MDLSSALSYPTRDEQWISKILIGSVLWIIPFVNLIGYGYMLRAAKEVMNGNDQTMPEWDDFVGDFIRGLIFLVVSIVYYLPLIIMVSCLFLLGAATTNEDGGGIGILFFCCAFPLMFGYILIVSPILMAGAAHYAITEDFSAFLNFGGRFRDVTQNLGDTVMFIIFSLIVSFIASFLANLTIWLCIGIAFFWGGQIILAHLLGQYGLAIGAGGASSPFGMSPDKPKNDYFA